MVADISLARTDAAAECRVGPELGMTHFDGRRQIALRRTCAELVPVAVLHDGQFALAQVSQLLQHRDAARSLQPGIGVDCRGWDLQGQNAGLRRHFECHGGFPAAG
jgi:hypothetical protein